LLNYRDTVITYILFNYNLDELKAIVGNEKEQKELPAFVLYIMKQLITSAIEGDLCSLTDVIDKFEKEEAITVWNKCVKASIT